ncbi:MAG: TetR/AcrR family transcriptional regulator [Burkholderiaceae bacterium]|nr:TetR/AcrR family transcriptional regulator [Burkholderiaceae bacterium]
MTLEPRATLRFAEKRELILDGAARQFNRRGIKAGTLAEVAASVGLATNSLTYYYRKKEDLVAACLMRSIEALDSVIDDAAKAAAPGDLAGCIAALVHGFVGLMASIAERQRPALIFFGDMRALPQPQAAPVFTAYVAMFRRLRGLLHQAREGAGAPLPQRAERRPLNARCHLLLSQLLWSRAWLSRYESTDFPRVAQAMVDVLLEGLAAPGQVWPAAPAAAEPVRPVPPLGQADELREAYLRTATRLVNDHGVGGASVERIAATLELTKGSFYHHHDTKHGLIDDCFERSFALIRGAQLAALAQPGNGWQRLLAATVPLVRLQTSPQGPLLRLTAWTELPGELRWQKLNTMNRLGARYAAMIVDGMIDGSLRLLDPAVAAQMVSGLLNGLAEAEHWLPGDGPPALDELLARPMLLGLGADLRQDAAVEPG